MTYNKGVFTSTVRQSLSDSLMYSYQELSSLENTEILEKIISFDSCVAQPTLKQNGLFRDFILLATGLLLRKKGLSHIAKKVWEFCQNAKTRAYFSLPCQEFVFLALNSSRYLGLRGFAEGLSHLHTQAFPYISRAYHKMPDCHSSSALDIFYYQRAHIVHFPIAHRGQNVIQFDFDKKTPLAWDQECRCGSSIPYGECCGLYR